MTMSSGREVEELQEVAKLVMKSITIDVFAHARSMLTIRIFYFIGRREPCGRGKGEAIQGFNLMFDASPFFRTRLSDQRNLLVL
jgi:hypothetical protein